MSPRGVASRGEHSRRERLNASVQSFPVLGHGDKQIALALRPHPLCLQTGRHALL